MERAGFRHLERDVRLLFALLLMALAGPVQAQTFQAQMFQAQMFQAQMFQAQTFCGGDVSDIPQVEAAGGIYSYRGKIEDPFAIMKEAGWNLVRFRIWNDPKNGDCDKEYVLKLAKRAQAAGLNISLDFHYSDWWADPGKQYAPAAWKDYPLEKLESVLYSYTKDVVSAMIRQGTPPVMVQVGNEILSGMCWPVGRLEGDKEEPWQNLAGLLRAGIQAIRDAAKDQGGDRKILTMIHLDRGGDNKGARWWFDHIQKEGVEFDMIGLSYYPFWHGTLDDLKQNLNDLATRYGKDLMVAETAYPWADADPDHQKGALFDGKTAPLAQFPVSPDGQREFLEAVKKIIHAVPGGHGKGFLYWAPTWISLPKAQSAYANLALFDYDGKALPGVDSLQGN